MKEKVLYTEFIVVGCWCADFLVRECAHVEGWISVWLHARSYARICEANGLARRGANMKTDRCAPTSLHLRFQSCSRSAFVGSKRKSWGHQTGFGAAVNVA